MGMILSVTPYPPADTKQNPQNNSVQSLPNISPRTELLLRQLDQLLETASESNILEHLKQLSAACEKDGAPDRIFASYQSFYRVICNRYATESHVTKPEIVAQVLTKLGSNYHLPEAAERRNQEALDIWRHLNLDRADGILCYYQLGLIYNKKRRFRLAKENLHLASQFMNMNGMGNTEPMSRALVTLAKIYRDERDYTTASSLFKQALEVRQGMNGGDSSDCKMANILMQLGGIHLLSQLPARKYLDEALKYYGKSKEMFLTVDTLESEEWLGDLVMFHISGIYWLKENWHMAEKTLEAGIKLREERSQYLPQSGTVHKLHQILTSEMYEFLGSIYDQKMDRLDEAIIWYNQALEIYKTVFTDKLLDHHMARRMHEFEVLTRKLASAYERIENFDEAIKYYREAAELMKICDARFGKNSGREKINLVERTIKRIDEILSMDSDDEASGDQQNNISVATNQQVFSRRTR